MDVTPSLERISNRAVRLRFLWTDDESVLRSATYLCDTFEPMFCNLFRLESVYDTLCQSCWSTYVVVKPVEIEPPEEEPE